MDAQASQGSFHLPSSVEDFSPSSTMDVTSQGSGAVSDISQQCVSGSRWHVRGGIGRDRRVTVKARPCRGGRGIREGGVLVQGLVVERGVEEQSIQAAVTDRGRPALRQLVEKLPMSCFASSSSTATEYLQLDRLNVNLGHWPKHADRKGNCAVSYHKKK